LLVSAEVKVFHATEIYSSSDLTSVKYNMKRLSIDEKENVTAPNKTKELESLSKYIVHVMVKIKLSIKNNSQIFNSIHTIYTRTTKFIIKEITYFPSEGNNSGFTSINLHVVCCIPAMYGVNVHLK
jgi:hypothetical protein